jgi:hypothetical protein
MPETAERVREVLAKMLGVPLSSLPADRIVGPVEVQLSDLLPEIGKSHPDAGWVHGVYDGLLDLTRSIAVRLLACEYEPGPEGFLCIAATSPWVKGEVVPGDWVQAGFAAIRAGDRPLRLSRRIFRPVCANGSIVWVHESDVLAHDSQWSSTVIRSFDPRVFDGDLEVLRAAAAQTQPALDSLFDEMQRLFHEGAMSEELMMRWSEWDDRRRPEASSERGDSLWDRMNDMTAYARQLDWRERWELEELAGSLARLIPPRPRRTPGEALQLVEG